MLRPTCITGQIVATLEQGVMATRLYFTPCDELGNTLVVRNAAGEIVDGYMTAGAYP